MSEQEDARERAIARARSIKAFKIARILSLTDASTFALWGADRKFRAFVADKAGVNMPSDASWDLAIEMLDVMRRG